MPGPKAFDRNPQVPYRRHQLGLRTQTKHSRIPAAPIKMLEDLDEGPFRAAGVQIRDQEGDRYRLSRDFVLRLRGVPHVVRLGFENSVLSKDDGPPSGRVQSRHISQDGVARPATISNPNLRITLPESGAV